VAEDAAAALPPFDVSCHAVSEPSLYHILGELPTRPTSTKRSGARSPSTSSKRSIS
jgi:hypothetical protein